MSNLEQRVADFKSECISLYIFNVYSQLFFIYNMQTNMFLTEEEHFIFVMNYLKVYCNDKIEV
jgi:hypothetical protein